MMTMVYVSPNTMTAQIWGSALVPVESMRFELAFKDNLLILAPKNPVQALLIANVMSPKAIAPATKQFRRNYAWSWLCLFAVTLSVAFLTGCATPPDLTGYPVSTPKFYSENKAFFLKPLAVSARHSAQQQEFQHLYQVNPKERENDAIRHNDPISVVLQGVRIPEDLHGGSRDIAVILDIHTSGEKGVIGLVAFYQRDVRPGQMLNFNNLLVYADPMWDSANPPFFRVRVLDVKAERNRRTGQILSKLTNLSSQIGGVVPHPAIPIVTSAIDAANLLLSNQGNVMLVDFQIQLYSQVQVRSSGGATLGPLLAGQWLVVGRGRAADSSFWERQLYLDRKTDRIVQKVADSTAVTNVPVPYVSIVLMRADAEIPKMVLDRSESLISLLSTPSGKSDVDSLEVAASNLMSAVDAFTVERRLRKYHSKMDLEGIIDKLKAHVNKKQLNPHEVRRLIYVLNRVAKPSPDYANPEEWIKWWDLQGGANGAFKTDPDSPLGVVYEWSRSNS